MACLCVCDVNELDFCINVKCNSFHIHLYVCSLAVRDEAVKSVLLSEAAEKTVLKLLASASVSASDIDEIVHEMQSKSDNRTTDGVILLAEGSGGGRNF